MKAVVQPGSARAAQRPLILLVMAAAIPLVLFAGWVVFLNARQERTDSRLAALETLDRVVTRISSDLALQVQIAETLAASASLDASDLTSFYVEALRVKETRPLWETIELVDPKGNQVLNLLRPIGADLGATADRENFERILTTRKAAIGELDRWVRFRANASSPCEHPSNGMATSGSS